jgi:hypothetical protein
MFKRICYLLGLFALILIITQSGVAQSTGGNAPVEVSGWFSVLWGDGSEENPASSNAFYLTTVEGEIIDLLIDDLNLDLTTLLHQQVRVTGNWLQAPDSGKPAILEATNVVVERGGYIVSGYSEMVGNKPWAVIQCKYAGYADEPKYPEYYAGMLSSEYPGLDHYWGEQSYGLVNLDSSAVYGWYQLPHEPEYYLPPEGQPMTVGVLMILAQDCISAANEDVDFTQFYGVMMMLNADPYLSAYGTLNYFCIDGVCRDWGFTWIPPWGIENIGIVEHEMGHGFGLLHSSGEYGLVYDNAWDLMSDVWSNKARGAIDPVYGGMGQHTIFYHKHRLGWVDNDQMALIRPGTRATLTLERLALPQSENLLGAKVLINNDPIHFITVEARQQVGYDFWLPSVDGWNQSVILHDVNTWLWEPAHVIDIDYNGETEDAGAMWLPGEVYYNSAYGVRISIDDSTPTGFIVTIWNRYHGTGFKYLP